MTAWLQLTITSSRETADSIADLLNEHGALSITLEDAGEEPLFQLAPNETPLWSLVKVVALFPLETEIDAIVEFIRLDLKKEELDFSITELAEQDWVRETQKRFPPQCFAEKLWVLPSWCDRSHYSGPKISIDPGLAFGTGTHPTTSLCLEWLAKNSVENKTVVDYGCGSGILALSALALGASNVYALDHDPQALQATENNSKLNDFGSAKLHILAVEEPLEIKAEIILANILSQPLIALASTIKNLAAKNATLGAVDNSHLIH